MRTTFIETLVELAEQDERIILLTADLGYTVLERFADRFPDRYFNVGVAEQNMMGMVTGLAEAGLMPFAYSIGTFASLRAYEFFRNGAIMHQLPVRVVGIGAGLEYATAGLSHNSLEEIAVMRTQPALRLIAPADYEQTRQALLDTWQLPGPIYYRLGKNQQITVPGLEGRFGLDEAQIIGEGTDLLLVVTGSIAAEVMKVAADLSARKIDSTVMVLASLNPSPNIAEAIAPFSAVMTVEDHYINGGIGSLVAEVIAEQGLGCRLRRCGVNHRPDGITGSLAALRRHYGLDRESLLQAALSLVKTDAA